MSEAEVLFCLLLWAKVLKWLSCSVVAAKSNPKLFLKLSDNTYRLSPWTMPFIIVSSYQNCQDSVLVNVCNVLLLYDNIKPHKAELTQQILENLHR